MGYCVLLPEVVKEAGRNAGVFSSCKLYLSHPELPEVVVEVFGL